MSNVVAFPARQRIAKKTLADPPSSDALSFVRRRKEGRKRGCGYDYWAVTPSGNYGDDCATGRQLAQEYLAFIGKWPANGNSTLLTCIVRGMIDQGKNGGAWSGLHVGFLSGVNSHAMTMAATMSGGDD